MVLIDGRHRQALIIVNLAVDYLKDSKQLDNFILFAINGMRKTMDSTQVQMLVKNVVSDVKEQIHQDKISH